MSYIIEITIETHRRGFPNIPDREDKKKKRISGMADKTRHPEFNASSLGEGVSCLIPLLRENPYRIISVYNILYKFVLGTGI